MSLSHFNLCTRHSQRVLVSREYNRFGRWVALVGAVPHLLLSKRKYLINQSRYTSKGRCAAQYARIGSGLLFMKGTTSFRFDP